MRRSSAESESSFLLKFQKHSVLLAVRIMLILHRAPIHDQNNGTEQWSFCCIWISRQECCYLIIKTTEVPCFCRLQIMKGSITDLLGVIV